MIAESLVCESEHSLAREDYPMRDGQMVFDTDTHMAASAEEVEKYLSARFSRTRFPI